MQGFNSIRSNSKIQDENDDNNMVISPLHTVDQSLVLSDHMITSPLPTGQRIFSNIGNYNVEDVQDELVGTNGGGQDNLLLTVGSNSYKRRYYSKAAR